MMTKEEFTKLRNELSESVVKYELLQRKITFLQNGYLLNFVKALRLKLKVESEMAALVAAINSDDPDAVIAQKSSEFIKNLEIFEDNYKKSLDFQKKCQKYSQSDMLEFDREFAKFCALNHPAIKTHTSYLERSTYNSLSLLHRIGNFIGYKKFLAENSDVFKPEELNEAEFEDIAKIYRQSLKNVNEDIEKCSSEFPLNKEYVFKDENALLEEEISLRENNAKLREGIKALKVDFYNKFKKEFKF